MSIKIHNIFPRMLSPWNIYVQVNVFQLYYILYSVCLERHGEGRYCCAPLRVLSWRTWHGASLLGKRSCVWVPSSALPGGHNGVSGRCCLKAAIFALQQETPSTFTVRHDGIVKRKRWTSGILHWCLRATSRCPTGIPYFAAVTVMEELLFSPSCTIFSS